MVILKHRMGVKMEITILKCDRCKKEVDGLIEFSFINRNVEPEEKDKSDDLTLNSMLWGLGKTKQYPTVHGGLCLDCVQEISRWLGHPENILSRNEVVK
jgi:hypothetical protein